LCGRLESDDPRNTSSTYASLFTLVWGGDNDSSDTTKSIFLEGENVCPSGMTSPETSKSTKDTSDVPGMLLVAIDEELIVAVDAIDAMERKYLTVNVDKMLSYIIDTPNIVGRRFSLSILSP
jgi:hypothetical protein